MMCPNCGGTGKVKKLINTKPFYEKIECTKCNGVGYLERYIDPDHLAKQTKMIVPIPPKPPDYLT